VFFGDGHCAGCGPGARLGVHINGPHRTAVFGGDENGIAASVP
jgi:hypothetical protein